MELAKFNIPTFIYDFLFSLEEKGRTEGTIIRYGYYIEEFCDWLRKEKKTDVTFELWKGLTKEDYFTYYTRELLQKRSYEKYSLKRIESVLVQLHLHYKAQHPEIMKPTIEMHKKDVVEHCLTEKDFMKEEEFESLVEMMGSLEGLTENQKKGRGMLIKRNISIVTLFYKYGLTINELISLKMKDLNFGLNFKNRRYIVVQQPKHKIKQREIEIESDDSLLLLDYLKDIPQPVRPKFRSEDPLFVAFDYQRLTFRWVYDNDDQLDYGQPKVLSKLAVQKMIKEEGKRTNNRRGISSRQMRNSAILRSILSGETDEEVIRKFGLVTPITLRRFHEYIESTKE